MMHALRAVARRLGRALLHTVGDEYYPPLETLPDVPDLFHIYRVYASSPALTRRPGGWEYEGRVYPDMLTVGGASLMTQREALRHCIGHGVDIGAGLWPLPGATPVDVWRGPGAGRRIEDVPAASLDYVFSSHCLEHIADWAAALSTWVSLVRPGGVIFLYLPHPDCGLWRPGSPMVGDEHRWQPEPSVIKRALAERGCDVVAADDGPDAMMSFFVCARRVADAPPGRTTS